MRIFISGGVKNGKSRLAQRLAVEQRGSQPLYYIATMRAGDAEDEARILRHRNERQGQEFITIEQSTAIAAILLDCNHQGSFLIDSLTALLGNEMFPPREAVDVHAWRRIEADLKMLLLQLPNIIIVSDYIYGDGIQYDALSETYRQSLAMLDRSVAQLSDVVLEISFGSVITHKGGEAWDAFNQALG